MLLRHARHYDSTLQASLDATEVPVPVYLNLIEAVHGNLDKMYRYVALRKKVMGVDELHMYDVYTPIVADATRRSPMSRPRRPCWRPSMCWAMTMWLC